MPIIETRFKRYNTDYQAYHLYEPEVTVTYEGAVLEVFQADYRVMSDVYTYAWFALVWDEDECTRKRILLDANFECVDYSFGNTKAVVDATPEVLARIKKLEQDMAEQRARDVRETEAKTPRVGKRMTVAKGRTAKGYTGYLCYQYDTQWGPKFLMKDRLEDAKNKGVPGHWVYGYNLVPASE